MGIFGFSGLKSSVSTALAVTLTSLLTWVFASSTANIQWLGSTAVTTTIASAQVQPGPNQNA